MFVNLTPHAINIVGGPTIPPSGMVARLAVSVDDAGTIDGIPVVRTTYGKIRNLPDPTDGTIFIVSSLIAERSDRHDLAVPNDLVRDDAGAIVGCRNLSLN